MDAERINQLIQITGAQWEAKDTPLSKAKVAPGAMKYMGLAISPSEISKEAKLAARTEPRAVSLQPPPPKVDWRNNGGNFVTEIKNQHECGACVAFATCAVLESRARIAQQAPHLNIDLSEAHLFACGCGDCCDTGWVNSKALDFARRKGIGAETDFPYNTMRRDGCKPINAIVKVRAYAAIETLNVRKKVVAAKGPVSASMEVYEDFLSYGRGIYQHVTGSLIGYHAVCVVGYDDTDRMLDREEQLGPRMGRRRLLQDRLTDNAGSIPDLPSMMRISSAPGRRQGRGLGSPPGKRSWKMPRRPSFEAPAQTTGHVGEPLTVELKGGGGTGYRLGASDASSRGREAGQGICRARPGTWDGWHGEREADLQLRPARALRTRLRLRFPIG